MAKEQLTPDHRLNKGQKIFRRASQRFLEPWFVPSDQLHVYDGMKRAEQLHQDGYGMLFLITHFSRRDPVQAMDAIMKSKVFKDVPITGPIARHQTVKGLVFPAGRGMGVNMHPVITAQTLEKLNGHGNASNLKLGDGTYKYIKEAVKALARGEVVVMAPQATRRPHLEYNGEDSVSGLLSIASRKTDKIGIHAMSFGLAGTENYADRRGFNFFRSYDIYHGQTFTLQEALDLSQDRAKQMGIESSGMDNMDRFIFEELAKVSPPNYLKP